MEALKQKLVAAKFQLRNAFKQRFECPLCGYRGPFADHKAETGSRKHAMCPKCWSMERHRLQKLVLDDLKKHIDFSSMRVLHMAPETFFRDYLKKICGNYLSADLDPKGVDVQADLTALPFKDGEFDFVFASHVLEHVREDKKALAEIARVLSPSGLSFLPVPMIGEKTIEYPAPNPHETFHVRAPGFDYYERYKEFFAEVRLFSSTSFAEKYQVYVYEDRTWWPDTLPLRPIMYGKRHLDLVPVCFKNTPNF